MTFAFHPASVLAASKYPPVRVLSEDVRRQKRERYARNRTHIRAQQARYRAGKP